MAEFELLPSIESQIAIIIAIIVIVVFLIRYYRITIELSNKLEQKQEKAYAVGQITVRGELNQILGTFGLLNEYNELIFLSTTSKQASLDLMGVKEDSLDFIELKTKGAQLTSGERKIQRLVREKKINWVTKDVELPQGFKMTDRA